MTMYNATMNLENAPTEVRHLQVSWLRNKLDWTYEKISALTGYAVNTCRSLASKYRNSLELAKKYFNREFFNTVRFEKKTTFENQIRVNADYHYLLEVKDRQMTYLFKFLDKDYNLVCSKVGTTTRAVLTRLKEELRSDTYVKMGAYYAVVDRIYDCGEIPAEGLESYFRAEYIRRYPQSFKKNDRFIHAEFDLAECDEMVKQYLHQ